MSLPSRERGLKYRDIVLWQMWLESLPSRERGLKLYTCYYNTWSEHVAPLAGAWIEIVYNWKVSAAAPGRSPRGSVD